MFLVGCAGSSGAPQNTAVTEVEEVAATETEQSLLAALNAERRRGGKAELVVSPVLTRLARSESDSAAAAAQVPGDTTAMLRAKSGFGSVGKLQGVLKDRGTPTGKKFVEYWAEGTQGMVWDDWGNVGVGVSKAADGRLFAIVLLGTTGGGGASLMDPAMAPSGF